MENKTKKKGLLERITSSRVFRVMFSRKIIVVCAILLLIMVLIAIFAPVIAPYDPNKDDLYNVLKGCSAEHWLGTDSNGRDVLSRIIYGARISFTVGIVAVVISSVIGMALGLIAGMAGGVVDAFIMRVMDHRVCGRIFVDSIVQCHNPAAILRQQRYAGIDIILASKDLRFVEQNFLFYVAKGEVIAHLDGDSVFVRNNTLLQIHFGHGIDLNRAQVTQLLVSEVAADVFAYVVNSIDILIAIDIAALVPATEQIILISSLFAGIHPAG